MQSKIADRLDEEEDEKNPLVSDRNTTYRCLADGSLSVANCNFSSPQLLLRRILPVDVAAPGAPHQPSPGCRLRDKTTRLHLSARVRMVGAHVVLGRSSCKKRRNNHERDPLRSRHSRQVAGRDERVDLCKLEGPTRCRHAALRHSRARNFPRLDDDVPWVNGIVATPYQLRIREPRGPEGRCFVIKGHWDPVLTKIVLSSFARWRPLWLSGNVQVRNLTLRLVESSRNWTPHPWTNSRRGSWRRRGGRKWREARRSRRQSRRVAARRPVSSDSRCQNLPPSSRATRSHGRWSPAIESLRWAYWPFDMNA